MVLATYFIAAQLAGAPPAPAASPQPIMQTTALQDAPRSHRKDAGLRDVGTARTRRSRRQRSGTHSANAATRPCAYLTTGYDASSTIPSGRRERSGLLPRRLAASFYRLGGLLAVVVVTGSMLGPIFESALVGFMAACILFLLGVALHQSIGGSSARRR